ncbi:hypothetical protein EDD17DRAFT_1012168 [Pisolithus thermaeus]|nr:hypothetical protein EV401DRAFT_1454925 [Pisolithus croceorrhizus]KAI6158314.1 hypothetical protein EDD17DRAFT_1012168 [Pisolithus thermaeus]
METSTAGQRTDSSRNRNRNRNRRRHAVANDQPDGPTTTATTQEMNSRFNTSTRPTRGPQSERDTKQDITQNTENRGPTRRRPPRKKPDGSRTGLQSDEPSTANTTTAEADLGALGEPSEARSQPQPRRRAFNPKLTQPPEPRAVSESSSGPRRTRRSLDSPTGADLTSTLTRALRTPPYPDCLICFSSVRPEHPTWSRSPPKPSLRTDPQLDDPDKERSQCCWTTFHLKCIRVWADKSVKSLADAWRARGEERPGEWRCPGCQTKREQVPTAYQCFCHRTSNPSPPRLSTPHSCGLACSRPLSSGCGHPCPLPCHPGPCPPCGITVQRSCFCGEVVRSAKCSASENPAPSEGLQRGFFSCMKTCSKPLSCKNPRHRCELPCHAEPCPPCPVKEEVRCWCGSETKVVACGELSSEDATKCVVSKDTLPDGTEEEEIWFGWFGCGKTCSRPFSCGNHTCSKPCHPPSRTPPLCPFDPISVTRCGCGRSGVARYGEGMSMFSTDDMFPVLPARASCTSPLPVCSSVCLKSLPCGHSCTATCHWGVCPPCTMEVAQPCRCGSTKQQVKCSKPEDILCNRPCPVLRSCGRHQCSRICCPLASLATGKGKKKVRSDVMADLGTEPGGLHECTIPCRRVLGCGNHRCDKKDHKGPCGVCLRSIFEEIACPCNRTVFEPPITCGTRLTCAHPCVREPPCGHPVVPHACHESTIVVGVDTADEGLPSSSENSTSPSCPPCPFLTGKLCVCGKKMVDNVQCSQERVSCGNMCRRLLPCGFHECKRTCHADECGPCTMVCGKSRKTCLPEHHPCTEMCHAPAACPETGPCLILVTLTCPCGNRRSSIPCSNKEQCLACNEDCAVRKRNEKLAEAFGISREKREEIAAGPKVIWSDELIDYARATANTKFVRLMEDTLADFVRSSRRTQVLQYMSAERRKFVQDLASVYRVDTTEVDQEPHRSVQLIRRMDMRIPVPLLSQSAMSVAPSSKLVDLRSSRASSRGTGAELSKTATAAAKTACTPCSQITPAWRAPSSSLRSTPPPYVVNSPGAVSSGSLPPHLRGPSPPSYTTLQVQAQREQPVAVAREDVPENWEDDV